MTSKILTSQTFALTDQNFSSGQMHTIWKIWFELGNSTLILKDDSKLSLDSIELFLVNNPDSKIEIGVHTDKRGTLKTNLALSQTRADEIKKYLISKGIQESRLLSKGYGQTKPYFTKDQEADHQRRNKCSPDDDWYIGNRRVTLTIR